MSIVLVKLDLNNAKEYQEGDKFALQSSILLMWSFIFTRFAKGYDKVAGFILSVLNLITNCLRVGDALDHL